MSSVVCIISEASEYSHIIFPIIVGDARAVFWAGGSLLSCSSTCITVQIRGIKTGDRWVDSYFELLFYKVISPSV